MTIRRAAHFVPGANEKMLGNSLETDADALILDLEFEFMLQSTISSSVVLKYAPEH